MTLRMTLGTADEAIVRVEARLEAVGQLAEVLLNAPARVGAVWRFRPDLNFNRGHVAKPQLS